jgi:hypothetical protein
VGTERVVIKDQGSSCGEFNPHASQPKLDKDIHLNCLIGHRINSTDQEIQDNANLLSSKLLESVNNKVKRRWSWWSVIGGMTN